MLLSLDKSAFTMPVCYHPTTVLEIDDDVNFLDTLSFAISKKIALLCFDKPEKALAYAKSRQPYLPFTARCLIDVDGSVRLDIQAIRNEIYNNNRFKEIFISVTDYDMPHISGLDLVKTLEFPRETTQYANIFLTGKSSPEFKDNLKKLGLYESCVEKGYIDYISKLLNMINQKAINIFQWYSYMPARILSRDPQQQTYFLFDGNFTKILNEHMGEDICELYLFDKQGSYLFLDQDAKISWFFVRNEQGIENTIRLATEYGAPRKVIQELKSKKSILSLYEKEDFENRKTIKWDDYLLPASVFKSDATYLNLFPDLLHTANGTDVVPVYYYAFTQHFPEQQIKEKKIKSYRSFLQDEN